MKKYFVIPVMIFLTFCSTDKQENVSAIVSREAIVNRLLEKYKTINFDTLSVDYSWQDSTESKYYGTVLDSTDLSVFRSTFLQESIYSYFACYKFSLADNKLGLITRAPSEYSSTKIFLYIYDSKLDSIISSSELADEWGDAGDYYKMNSWLVNLQKELRIFTETYYSSVNFEEDPSGNKEDTDRSNFLLKYTGGSIDTLLKNDSVTYTAFKNSVDKGK